MTMLSPLCMSSNMKTLKSKLLTRVLRSWAQGLAGARVL